MVKSGQALKGWSNIANSRQSWSNNQTRGTKLEI